MSTEFQLGKVKNVLEIDDGDGCTTIGMYLMSQTVYLKMVKIVSFMPSIYILP